MCVFLVFFTVFLLETHASEECAIVTDLSGTVTVLRNGKNMPLDIGHALFVGDEILLAQGATLIAVTYEDCAEWRWAGGETISVESEGFQSKGHEFDPSRELPMCYHPDSYEKTDSNVIGGFVLRGSPSDPLAPLRKEFAEGNASNSSLIALVLHEIEKGNMEQAKKYFDAIAAGETTFSAAPAAGGSAGVASRKAST